MTGKQRSQALQREKAQAAAVEVTRFARRYPAQPGLGDTVHRALSLERPRAAPLRVPEAASLGTRDHHATLVGADGRESLRVSRIEADRLSSGIDLSGDPAFSAARTTRAHFSDVRFVAQTEPYLTVAAPSAARDGSVVIADVNLKFVRTVVSEIRVGETGYAYVVDARGRLVSHPEMSLVLQMTDMSRLPQVRAATASGAPSQGFADDAHALDGRRYWRPTQRSHRSIGPCSWNSRARKRSRR